MGKQLTQGERLVKIETDIDYIKKEIVKNGTVMSDFINSADEKYTHKEEFDDFKNEVRESKKARRSWAQHIPVIILGVASIVLGILAIG